ncbi:hypothetical protein MOQ_004037, partial [Trypanosoma cruzi marinkellei]
DEAVAENAELQTDRDEAVSKIAELQTERDEAVSKIVELQTERDEAVSKIAELQRERNEGVAEISELEGERDVGCCVEDVMCKAVEFCTIRSTFEGLRESSDLPSFSCCLAEKENRDGELCSNSNYSLASDTLRCCECVERSDDGHLAVYSVCGASIRDSFVLGHFSSEVKKDVDSHDVVIPVVGCPLGFSGNRKGVDREGYTVNSISSKGSFSYVGNGAPLGVFRL